MRRSTPDGTHRRSRAPPRGARPRAEVRAGVALGRAHRRGGADGDRRRAARGGLEPGPRRPASTWSPPTPASTTTSSTPRSRSTRSPSASAGRARRASTPSSRWRAAAAGVRPLEMTKWLDTNYHYLVPELADGQALPRPSRALGRRRSSRRATSGIAVRPVVLGPFSFVLPVEGARPAARRRSPPWSPVYAELLGALADAGAARGAARRAVPRARPATRGELERGPRRRWRRSPRARPEVCLATYFAPLDDGVPRAAGAGSASPSCTSTWCAAPGAARARPRGAAGAATRLSLGVIDGRNVWAADLDRALGQLDAAVAGARRRPRHHRALVLAAARAVLGGARDGHPGRGARLARLRRRAAGGAGGSWPAPSPRPAERDVLLRPLAHGRRVAPRLGAANDPAVRRPRRRRRRRRPRPRGARSSGGARPSASASGLPELPTTTIGSFPQTDAIRAARRDLRAGTLGPADYDALPRGAGGRGGARCRRSSAWTCSCTASPSATTWSSTSASSCAGSPSPSTAGSSPTGAAA